MENVWEYMYVGKIMLGINAILDDMFNSTMHGDLQSVFINTPNLSMEVMYTV